MTLEDKNQNDILQSEIMDSYSIDCVFSDKPINRLKTKPKVEGASMLLHNLRDEIKNIENCKLKNNSTKLVFSDGDLCVEPRVAMIGG